MPVNEDSATSYVLDNGLTVILKQDSRTPTFSLSVFIRTGSSTEGKYAGSGITHYIEHTIFKGTSTRSAQQIEDEIKALGGGIGAYTSFDYTAFNMYGPAENLLPSLDILNDILANPKFDKTECENEKEVIKKEMRLINDDPQKYLSRQLWQTAYLIHPYRNPIIGYEEVFDKLTPEDLKAYFSEFYVPNNMVLVIAGNMQIKDVSDKLVDTFGKLSRKSFTLAALPREPLQLTPRARDIPYAVSKSYMMMGFHTVNLLNSDLYALDILSIILGEGRSSILYQDLHNKLNLVYSISAYNYTPFNPGMFIISAIFEPGNKDIVVGEVFNQIDKIKDSPLKKEELDKAKNQVISSYIFSKQTQSAQVSDLGTSQMLTGDLDFSRNYCDGVSAVTSQDIMDAARKYLTKENLTTVTLVPDNFKQASAIPQTLPARAVVKRVLRNGVRILLCEDKSLPIVSISACIGGGLRAEVQKNNGISNFTASMLLKGAGPRSEEDIFFFVESLGGSLSSYSGNNSFGLSLDLLSRDFKKGIDLFSEILLHASFPENKIRSLKSDTLAQIALSNDDIFYATEKRLRKALFENHPYGMASIGSTKSIEGLTRKDVVNFYRSRCLGQNVVISICGDININEAYNLAASRFKGIRKAAAPALRNIPLAPIKEQIELKDTMDKEQAVMMLGFRSAGVDNPDRYPLQILSSIYSDASGRLYSNIRQKKGMAYTLGAFGMTGMDTGTFIFYSASESADLDYIKNEITKQIREVSKGDVSDAEIESSKKTIITQYLIGLQSSGAFAQKIALDELYGLGYNDYLAYPEKISNVSKEETVATAKKYFTLDSCAISITVPKDKEENLE